MTRSASFLTDSLFPLLIMGCGALGLVVINFLAQQRRAQAALRRTRSRRAAPAAMRAGATTPVTMAPRARAAPRLRVRPVATVVASQAHHRVSFGTGLERADAGEVERLSGFLKSAFRPGRRVTVEGWGGSRKQRRLARARGRWVARQLTALGVSRDRIAAPSLSTGPKPARAGEHTILVVVRGR